MSFNNLVLSNGNKNIIYSNSIEMQNNRNALIRRLLDGITDSELQNLVNIRKSSNQRPSSVPRTRQSQRVAIPTPRRKVRQLIQYFEANPIPPYRPIPAPE